MKIALINEDSQASKNAIIYRSLKEAAEEKGHVVYNYGMYGVEGETRRTYVMNGLLAAILLNSGAVDFVVTGCGTGMGAMLACNSFPGVTCGFAVDPTDAYLFSQINGGNAISLPYAKGFGWGAELNLKLLFQRLFAEEIGGGYPKERAVFEKEHAGILAGVKKISYRPFIDVLKDMDKDFVKRAISSEHFAEYFYPTCRDQEIADYLRSL